MSNGRRNFIKSAGYLAVLGMLPQAGWAAQVCNQRVVVGTWGGDAQRLLQQNVDPLVAENKLDVIYDVGSALTRQTKMRAEKNARRTSMDISCLRDNDMYQMSVEGTLAPIDDALIPNMVHVIPSLRRSYAVPQMFSAMVLVYSTEAVSTAPTGMADLLDPRFKGRVGVVDDQYDYLTLAGALAVGKPNDLDAGLGFLKELRKNEPKVYPSVDALAGALKSGEIWVTMTWKARSVQWKKADLAVDYVFPKEGALPATFEVGVVAGSKVIECGVNAYLNALLSPTVQQGFAETMGYSPVITNANLSAELQAAVGFSEQELQGLVAPDFELLMKNKSALLDFWNRDFRVGL
ncbi:extracellular solute-binding protein [Alcaligenaceae bacterium]|nr:extracellular solute-binding protein [Alcaligenaceae bacterium]